jgi:hypothetical protein
MLTDLCRFALVDRGGRRGRLVDVVTDLSADEHPPVTDLIVRGPDGRATLPWGSVVGVDWPDRRLTVSDLGAAEPVGADQLLDATLLRRDVLDAMVIDLANRRTTRANDLWLRDEHGRLRLRGVDVFGGGG